MVVYCQRCVVIGVCLEGVCVVVCVSFIRMFTRKAWWAYALEPLLVVAHTATVPRGRLVMGVGIVLCAGCVEVILVRCPTCVRPMHARVSGMHSLCEVLR